MAKLLAPLRVVLIVACGFVLLPFALATHLPRLLGRPTATLHLSAWIQGVWARWTRILAGVSFEPRPLPAGGPFLITANHLSYVDILVLAELTPVRFVAKSEIARWPVLGLLTTSTGTIYLEQLRRRALVTVGEEMERTLAAGISVVLFPEGRASGGHDIAPFHAALLEPAARTGAPCLPVALSYRTPGAEFAPAWTVCWWGGMPFWSHLLRLAALPTVSAQVAWPSQAIVAGSRRELADALEAGVRAVFEPLPQTPIPPGESERVGVPLGSGGSPAPPGAS